MLINYVFLFTDLLTSTYQELYKKLTNNNQRDM